MKREVCVWEEEPTASQRETDYEEKSWEVNTESGQLPKSSPSSR